MSLNIVQYLRHGDPARYLALQCDSLYAAILGHMVECAHQEFLSISYNSLS